MKKYFLFSLIIGLTSVASAAPEMHITPQNVTYGNRIQLILSDDKPIRNTPDLSQLQNDFVIRGQQQAEQTTIINGVRSETHQLILSLFPKKKGEITIGPFDWNGTRLPAQTIHVSDNPIPASTASQSHPSPAENTNVTENTNRLFKATATLQPDTIYTGESALYTIRLTENIGLTQAQIQTPTGSQFTLTPFGQDKMSHTTENGISARVYERSFLLTPTATGTFDLTDAGVLGLVPDTTNIPQRRFGLFPDFFGEDDFFSQGLGIPQKEVYAAANNLTVTVQPKPADWTGWWLPSQQVTLTEQYKISDPVYVGQPIERYVLLRAEGVDGNKLPLLVQPVNQSIQAYANPEKRMVQEKENGPLGIEEIMFVIIPTQTGDITIPAIQIDWFNTQTHQKETAQLPAKTIHVLPAAGTTNTDIPATTLPENTSLTPSGPDTNTPQNTLNTPNTSLTVPVETASPTLKASAESGFKKMLKVLDIQLLWLTIGILCGLIGLICFIRRLNRKRYLYNSTQPLVHKRKKPLPDLYPFE